MPKVTAHVRVKDGKPVRVRSHHRKGDEPSVASESYVGMPGPAVDPLGRPQPEVSDIRNTATVGWNDGYDHAAEELGLSDERDRMEHAETFARDAIEDWMVENGHAADPDVRDSLYDSWQEEVSTSVPESFTEEYAMRERYEDEHRGPVTYADQVADLKSSWDGPRCPHGMPQGAPGPDLICNSCESEMQDEMMAQEIDDHIRKHGTYPFEIGPTMSYWDDQERIRRNEGHVQNDDIPF